MLRRPKVHIHRVEYCQKRETPGDSVDDDLLSIRGKLIDDGTQQEKVDQRPVKAAQRMCAVYWTHGPDEEGPRGRSNISFLASEVDVGWDEDGGNVRAEEQKIHDHVDDLRFNYLSKNSYRKISNSYENLQGDVVSPMEVRHDGLGRWEAKWCRCSEAWVSQVPGVFLNHAHPVQ